MATRNARCKNAFVDLSAAYDTVNHRLLIQKLYNITQDSALCSHTEPTAKQKILCRTEQLRSRWRLQKNGLPQDINHGSLVWGNNFEAISKLQKKAIRTITHSHYIAHSEPLLKGT